MTDPNRTQATAAGAVPGTRTRPWSSALRLTGALLAAVLLAALTAVAGAADLPAQAAATGWIDGFDGTADDYQLTRDDRRVQVYPLLPLYPGDRIEVRSAHGRMRIHTSETAGLVIDPSHSPFTLPAAGQAPTPWGNLMDWAGRLFAGLHETHTQTQLVVTVGRGEETAPASGLLFAETVRLAPGRRSLALAWRHGKAPYRVRITPAAEGAAPLADLSGLTDARCQVPAIELTPGAYLIEVRDADDKTLMTGLSVVEAGALPRLDPAALPASLSDAAARTIGAAWLAGQEGGWVWRLEAYQQVAGVGDYAPAEWLRAALVAGRELPTGPVAGPSHSDKMSALRECLQTALADGRHSDEAMSHWDRILKLSKTLVD